jgi:hypothetical protein
VDLRCRCLGPDGRSPCDDDATEEDGYCDQCRLLRDDLAKALAKTPGYASVVLPGLMHTRRHQRMNAERMTG